jgi:hypothetical protein
MSFVINLHVISLISVRRQIDRSSASIFADRATGCQRASAVTLLIAAWIIRVVPIEETNTISIA